MISATCEMLKWRYDNSQENVLTGKKNRYVVICISVFDVKVTVLDKIETLSIIYCLLKGSMSGATFLQ